jgi:transposase
MIQITAQMRVLVAIEPVDGRKGIDSLARLCQEKLAEDPFSGCVFVFRSRSGTAIRLLTYDGQGYWLAQKRLSKGKFVWWAEAVAPAKPLEAYEAQLVMAAGDLSRVRAAPMWRRVTARKQHFALAFQGGLILQGNGDAPVPRPGDPPGRHPVDPQADRAAPDRQPAPAFDTAVRSLGLAAE